MDKENSLSIGEIKDGCEEITSGILPTAVRELAAFASAVREQYGAEQARLAIEDWMAELDLSDWPNAWSTLDCRRLTIAASARLAQRVNPQYQRRPNGSVITAQFEQACL
jgi:hypothetical protein